MSPARLLWVNGLIRVGAAGSGQLFAYLLAERWASDVGGGAVWVGVLAAAFFITELVGAPFAGRLADRVGQRRILGLGPLFGIGSATLAATVATSGAGLGMLISILLLARLTEGASAACSVPTTLVLLARATDAQPKRRTRIMGAFEVTSLVGMILGFAVVGFAWDAFGASAFFVLPPVYGLAWILLATGKKEPRGGVESRAVVPLFGTLRALASQEGALGFALAWLAVNAVVGVWFQYSPFLFSLPDRSASQALVGGFPGQTVGLIFAAWGLTFLVGIALWSWLGAAWPRRRAMVVALGGMMGVVGVLAAVNHGGSRLLLVAGIAFVLIESGFTPAAFAYLADATERLDASRGAALGVYSLLLGVGQLSGGLLGAPFVARWQMDGVLAVTAIMAVVGLAGLSRMGVTHEGASGASADHR